MGARDCLVCVCVCVCVYVCVCVCVFVCVCAHAGWAVESGAARHITLLSRSGRLPDSDPQGAWAQLLCAHANVRVVAADVACGADAAWVEQVFDGVPLPTTLVHAAGVLEDAMLAQQDLAKMRRYAVCKRHIKQSSRTSQPLSGKT